MCLLTLCPILLLALPPPSFSNGVALFPQFSSTLLNISHASINVSVHGRPPVCDGERAGTNLIRTSCEEAAAAIPKYNGQIQFSRRHTLTADVQIPRRFSSCMWLHLLISLSIRVNEDFSNGNAELMIKPQLMDSASLTSSYQSMSPEAQTGPGGMRFPRLREVY